MLQTPASMNGAGSSSPSLQWIVDSYDAAESLLEVVDGVLWNLCVTIPHPMGNSCASPNPSPTMPCHRLAGGPSPGPIHCAVTRMHRAQQVHPFAFRDRCEPSSTVSKTTGFLVATG